MEPPFFVRKKEKLQDVIDYHAPNRINEVRNAPISRTNEMFDRLGKVSYFSKLDLKTGFHQIRFSPKDIEKTEFNAEYGHKEFFVIPMISRNAPATFQALMNDIFRDIINDYRVIYLEDNLIYSSL